MASVTSHCPQGFESIVDGKWWSRYCSERPGVDHARQVAGAVRAGWRRSVPAECAVECQGDQRDERASNHQIARHGSAPLSRHSINGRARCLVYSPAGLPSRLGTLHQGRGPLVSSAAIAGENPLSVSASGGQGVLAVCESSRCVRCQLARCAIAPARFNMRSRLGGGNVLALRAISPASVHYWCASRSTSGIALMAYRGTRARRPGLSHCIRPARRTRSITSIRYCLGVSPMTRTGVSW
jgi:hypothetical protein